MRRTTTHVATYSTIGQQSPNHVTLSRPYRYQGIQDWEPGDARFRETEKAARALSNSEAKAVRMAAFTAAREGGATVLEAGRAAGVASKTARSYEAERKAAMSGA